MKRRFLDFLPAVVRKRKNLAYLGASQLAIGVGMDRLGHPHWLFTAGVFFMIVFVAIFSTGEL